ncbi:FAD-dependent thymidylate synthase [Alkalibaculum sp. M08DMB]|uniref:Flavin-dependent thymidylate synthase n=1 Tax=Alkalibaculum sporogenes TaxID=2655001 RepID=A0A6A7K788_9FIRM|nr:FAD-dependent thymidylate synthase [Alkalibaculum sporogenes]MPW25047.1 FAD-dependent thymidylate synthase [Alkalibaculum sporogenes]
MQENLKVILLSYTPEPEKIISAAAKLCYSKSGIDDIMDGLTSEKVNDFLNLLMDMGHASPIEHVSFTFGIEGVSRSLTHQLVRHRVASYSQKSQRYVKEGEFGYIIPTEIANNEKAKTLFIEAMNDDQKVYDKLVEVLMEKHLKDYLSVYNNEKKAYSMAEKAAIEDARYVLPNACETKIVATMNARELLHFLNHRCCNRAQWEIRELATQMLLLVKEVAPIVFKVAGPNCIKGSCPEGTMTCGEIIKVRKKFENLKDG